MSDSDPDKPHCPPSPPRRKNRFNERELARAVRAALASGAERVDVYPANGKFSVILPGKAGAGETQSDNEVENWLSKQQQKAP